MRNTANILLIAGLLLTASVALAEEKTVAKAPVFVRENITGRPLNFPPPIAATSPAKSDLQEDEGGGKKKGSYSRISLRNRTRIN